MSFAFDSTQFYEAVMEKTRISLTGKIIKVYFILSVGQLIESMFPDIFQWNWCIFNTLVLKRKLLMLGLHFIYIHQVENTLSCNPDHLAIYSFLISSEQLTGYTVLKFRSYTSNLGNNLLFSKHCNKLVSLENYITC